MLQKLALSQAQAFGGPSAWEGQGVREGQEIGRGLAENYRRVQVGHGLAVGVRCHGPEDLRVSVHRDRDRDLGGLKVSARQVRGGEDLKVAAHQVPYQVDDWGFADEGSVEVPCLGAWETAYRPRFQVGSSSHAHKDLEARRGTGLGVIEIAVIGD